VHLSSCSQRPSLVGIVPDGSCTGSGFHANTPRRRKPTDQQVRELILRMVAENRTWGAPRIHGELRMLGFDVTEGTVLRWMRKASRDSEQARRWAARLSNHREAIAAMDFSTVPTLTCSVLYCFPVIAIRSSAPRENDCLRRPRNFGPLAPMSLT
jgi:hypothetical protein